jgi:hypothetical protein
MKNFYFTAKILLLSLAFFSLQAQAQNCSAPAEPYVNWSQCDKTFADLYYANLFAADLSGASLQYANLSGASLQFANLTEANLTEANLTNVFLNYANLTQVNLTQVNLTQVNLYGANLESAQLNQANLSGANLTNASLTNANLTGVTSGGITGTPTALPTGWVLANGYLIGSGANLNFCAGAKVAAAGSGLKFYTALTGGSPLAETTALATKTYYVTVTDASEGDRVLVTVTVNALPATPTLLVLTNEAPVYPATPDTAIKAVGVYVGAEAALKLTATAVGATSYVWTLPAGVTLADGFTTGTVTTQLNTINVKFSASAATSSLIVSVKSVNASGCSSLAKTLTLTRAIPVAPAYLKMNNGLDTTAITSFAMCMGWDAILRLTAAASATATSYVWELPEGVNRVTGIYDYNPIYSNESTVPEIFVTLLGVTSGNTHNYLTSAAVPVSTNVLRIGVKSKNGVGISETSNATLANSSSEFYPNAYSKAKLLTLTAVKPAAPATLKMYDLAVSATAAVTDITKYVNTETELTLTAAASTRAFANYYRWELPAGVTVTYDSDGNVPAYNIGGNFYESISNEITIKFNNYYQNPASSLVLGVRVVNGIGESVSTNAAPNASRTDKLLTLKAVLPTVPGTVTGSLKICATTASSVTYTIAAVAKNARDYEIEAPEGCTITMVHPDYGPYTSYDNYAGTQAVANASFTVNYPAGFIANTTTDVKTITIRSYNYVGPSATAKVLTLTNVGAISCPTAPAAPATLKMYDLNSLTPATAVTDITKYVNTETELTLTAAASAFANYYRWELPAGVSVTNNSAYNIGGNFYESTSNGITIKFNNYYQYPASSLVLGVRAVNGLGESVSTNAAPNASRTDKLLTLTAVLPTVPGTVSGSLKICATTASSVTYTIAALAAKALDYDIEAPQGCTITVVDPIYGPNTSYDNFLNIPAVANFSFTVNYPAGFIANTTTDVKTITIRSYNNVGPSATAKVLPLTNVGAVCTPAPGKIAAEATTADKFSAVAYPNPATEGFKVKSSNGKSIGVQVYDMLGRSIEQRQLQSEDQIGSNYAKGIYNVIVSQGTEVKTLRVIKQ